MVAGSVWGYQWTPDPARPLFWPEFSPNLNPNQSHDPPPSSLKHNVAPFIIVSLIIPSVMTWYYIYDFDHVNMYKNVKIVLELF